MCLTVFQFKEGQENDIDGVLPKFTDCCVGETCEAPETYKFHQRKQEKGHTIDAYVGALRQLAGSCNFGYFQDRMIESSRELPTTVFARNFIRKRRRG